MLLFSIRRRFSFASLLLVAAHPWLWRAAEQQSTTEALLFLLCSAGILIFSLLISEGIAESSTDSSKS